MSINNPDRQTSISEPLGATDVGVSRLFTNCQSLFDTGNAVSDTGNTVSKALIFK
jgi:hypothetical protein